MSANTFITNVQAHTLKKRLEELIQHSQERKFLVGYFYFSGWQELYESLKERDAMAKLAKQVQSLHTQRRKPVEEFPCEIGLEPAESTRRNPLESPWVLEESEFVKRARRYGTPDVRLFKSAQEEAISLMEEVVKVEMEIDEIVKALYGV